MKLNSGTSSGWLLPSRNIAVFASLKMRFSYLILDPIRPLDMAILIIMWVSIIRTRWNEHRFKFCFAVVAQFSMTIWSVFTYIARQYWHCQRRIRDSKAAVKSLTAVTFHCRRRYLKQRTAHLEYMVCNVAKIACEWVPRATPLIVNGFSPGSQIIKLPETCDIFPKTVNIWADRRYRPIQPSPLDFKSSHIAHIGQHKSNSMRASGLTWFNGLLTPTNRVSRYWDEFGFKNLEILLLIVTLTESADEPWPWRSRQLADIVRFWLAVDSHMNCWRWCDVGSPKSRCRSCVNKLPYLAEFHAVRQQEKLVFRRCTRSPTSYTVCASPPFVKAVVGFGQRQNNNRGSCVWLLKAIDSLASSLVR